MLNLIHNVRVWMARHVSMGWLIGAILSLLLHLIIIIVLLTAPFNVNKNPNDLPLIEAMLLQPSPPLKALKPKANAKPAKRPASEVQAPKPSQADGAEALNHNSQSPLSSAQQLAIGPPNTNVGNGAPSDAAIVGVASQEDDATLATSEPFEVNERAYTYVESYFDVRTDIDAAPDAGAMGKAKIVFQLTDNNTRYQIDSVTSPKGLAAIFIANLTQKSVGKITLRGLQPAQYLYQFGERADKTYHADFDWDHAQLNLTSIKGTQTVKLVDGTQDLLSFMYQFMYEPPLSNLQFYITNGKKLSPYSYLFEGEALVETKMGPLNTIHIARENADQDEKTDLWLAVDYQYLPVKIRKTLKNGKVYELLARDLLTKAP